MGFTLTRTNTSVTRSRPTPEQEAIAAANHDYMMVLRINPPIAEDSGSEKQVNWAKRIASQFLFHAHAWEFTAADIDLLFANTGKHARFWIDNRNPSGNSGEGRTRIAVENAIAQLKKEASVMAAMSSRTDAEFRAKARRF